MRIAKIIVSSLLGLLFCSLGLWAEDAAKPPEAKKIELNVRVVDRSGKPIAGAAVQAWKNAETVPLRFPIKAETMPIDAKPEILADHDGWARFSLSLAPKKATSSSISSCLYVTAQAKGFLVVRSDRLDPAKSDRYEVLMTMRHLESIEGRVLDDEGRPVAEATVFHTGNASPRVETKTDGDGRFKLDGLPGGKSPIFVTHPGFHFHGQLIDTANAKHVLKLLGKDRTPPPRKSLPPLLSHEEDRTIAKQTMEPLWESTTKSAEEGEKEWHSEWYAHVDPWMVYGEVRKRLKKESQASFFVRKMPLLYAADPEEAMAELESLETTEELKVFALLNAVRETPDLSRKQKLDLLDRAMQHAKAIVKPDEKIAYLSKIALRLYDAGNAEAAKKIVGEYAPQALPNLPKGDAYACAIAGEVIALFDTPAGVKLANSAQENEDDDFYRTRSLFHIAYRCAKTEPAAAERIVTDALQSSKESTRKYYLKEQKREPTAEEIERGLDYYEMRLIPICHWMAETDTDRSERLALSMHNPYLRAYALGMVAKTLATKDNSRARKDILQSYEILAEAVRNPQRHWRNFQASPTNTAGALLPTVEEVDPSLVDECLWQAVSFRLHRPADDFLIGSPPEYSDAQLAAFLARYDRELAAAIISAKDIAIAPSQEECYYRPLYCLAMIDPRQALHELSQSDLSAHLGDRRRITELLTTPWARRWNNFASDLYIWTPDYEIFDSAFPW